MMFSARRWGLLAGLWALAQGGLSAQALDYPARPVSIVVPFAAGGGTDILGRLVAQQLEQRLGRPFIIENRPGAGSTTGAGFVARANPDGYTLLMAPSPTLAVAITIYKHLAYDPLADFVPLALIAQTPFVLIVNPALPAHSVAELIALVKERPGQLSYGSAGVGTPHHLYFELMKSMIGIELQHVPYRGSLAALTDLVAGHIPVMICDLAPAIEMIASQKVRPLGISTAARFSELPDVPPIADAIPGFDASGWQMVVAPAATPGPVIARLHAAIKSTMDAPEIRAELIRLGMTPFHTPPVAELPAFVKAEGERWARIIRQAGIAGSQ
jgi:tripartite-type tricarboxylate transporter receptor subunit TctC